MYNRRSDGYEIYKDAGNLIKAIAKTVGGGGGGRPNMAQAGGKNPAGIADALAQAKSALEEQLK